MSRPIGALSICRSSLFLITLTLFMGVNGRIVRANGVCSDTCGPTANCSATCLDDFDQDSTCGDYNGGQSNGECSPNCSDVCGSTASCTTACSGGTGNDCGGYNGGQSNGECYGWCGDGVCTAGNETCNSCSTDCNYSCMPTCEIASCSVYTDCPSGGAYVCQDGCCIAPCSNTGGCGGHSRACSDDSTCASSADCCGNEVCVAVDYSGDGVCMGQVT